MGMSGLLDTSEAHLRPVSVWHAVSVNSMPHGAGYGAAGIMSATNLIGGLAQYGGDELVRERVGGARGVLSRPAHRYPPALVQLVLRRKGTR